MRRGDTGALYTKASRYVSVQINVDFPSSAFVYMADQDPHLCCVLLVLCKHNKLVLCKHNTHLCHFNVRAVTHNAMSAFPLLVHKSKHLCVNCCFQIMQHSHSYDVKFTEHRHTVLHESRFLKTTLTHTDLDLCFPVRSPGTVFLTFWIWTCLKYMHLLWVLCECVHFDHCV